VAERQLVQVIERPDVVGLFDACSVQALAHWWDVLELPIERLAQALQLELTQPFARHGLPRWVPQHAPQQ
jgi:hypothetical protein